MFLSHEIKLNFLVCICILTLEHFLLPHVQSVLILNEIDYVNI